MRCYLLWLLTVAFLIGGCSSSDRKLGDSAPVSKEQAIALATRLSPMKKVDEADLTPPGPRMWVLYGQDQSGRPLAAWVQKPEAIEGYTYLDQGVPSQDATAKAKAEGFTPMDNHPVLIRPSKPVWYVFVKSPEASGGQSYVLVDLSTGELTSPSGPAATAPSRSLIDCGTENRTHAGGFNVQGRQCLFDAYSKGHTAVFESTLPTTEGDPIVQKVSVGPGKIQVAIDTTKDKFSSQQDREVTTYTCTTMKLEPRTHGELRLKFENCTGGVNNDLTI